MLAPRMPLVSSVVTTEARAEVLPPHPAVHQSTFFGSDVLRAVVTSEGSEGPIDDSVAAGLRLLLFDVPENSLTGGNYRP